MSDAMQYKMLLCHRRAAGQSRKDFHAHWRGARRELVFGLQKELGFESYAQVHQYSRWNLIYQGARLSRSRFVTNLFARKAGRQITPKPDRQTMLAERWDVVEELVYPSREALVAALTAEAGRAAGARLVADQRPRVQRTAVMAVEVNPITRPAGKFPSVTTLFFLRSRPPMDREQMVDYWKNSHAKFFVSLREALAFDAYDQMYVREGEDIAQAVDALGGPVGEPFAAVARVAYKDQWTIGKGFLSPRTQIANIKLIKDEVTFIDGARSTLMLGEAHRFKSADDLSFDKRKPGMKKKILILLSVIAVLVLAWWLWTVLRPPAQDEAMQAGLSVEDFAQAVDEPDLLAGTDGGIELDAAGIRGRNTWWLWTAGNQAFWNWLANNSFGTFDLLKTMSSYPCSPAQESRARAHERQLGAAMGADSASGYGEADYAATAASNKYESDAEGSGLYADYSCANEMYPESGAPPYRYYDRDTRFCFAGLINEPGFKKPDGPDEYGLCLDEPTGEDPMFPGASEAESERLEKIYGKPSGVLGLRVFPNPEFDEKAERKWKEAMQEDRFYLDPKFYSDQKLKRPYRIGMTCGFCHISHHPLNPPEDPEHPEWDNLSGTIGAQYFWFARIFAPNIGADNFVWQLIGAQKPGAVDTSFLPHDNLFNPRAMNAVFELPARLEIAAKIGTETAVDGALDLPELDEFMADDEASATYRTPHVLWDGADSVTIGPALTRVYINIGEYHQQWIRTVDPLVGLRKQKPIKVEDAQENSVFWNATQARAEDMAAYLVQAGYRYPLETAPQGDEFLQGERGEEEYQQVLDRGEVAFAENCARCHSSKLPEPIKALGEPDCIGENYLACWKRYWDWTETDDFKGRMIEIVQSDDFRENNFLSTDARVPVHQPLIDFEPRGIDQSAPTKDRYLEAARQRGLATGALETEICSAMASNAIEGHVWEDFSSESYKSLPSVGTVDLYNPLTEQIFEWETQGGGRGYQRVPSLVGIWSTAPFLHNNELGEFTGDPSTAGRMAAFDDAIRKLLWPERRAGKVPRTSQVSHLKVELSALPWRLRAALPLRHLVGLGFLVNDEDQVQIGPIPGPHGPNGGTPIGLVGNLNLARTDADFGLLGLAGTALGAAKDFKRIERENLGPDEISSLLSGLVPDLIDKSACPDFIVDRGHYFGSDLRDEEKEALIDFVKTL